MRFLALLYTRRFTHASLRRLPSLGKPKNNLDETRLVIIFFVILVSYNVRVEIAAVAESILNEAEGLLRNDIKGLLLSNSDFLFA